MTMIPYGMQMTLKEMSRTMIVPGRGRVKVDNGFCGSISFSSGNSDRDYYRESAYERTKREVYATGNKWAIENFHATHD